MQNHNRAYIDYIVAIINQDFATAEQKFSEVPETHHNGLARFLESRGHVDEALKIATDPELRFELSQKVGNLQLCADILRSAGESLVMVKSKWKALGDLALESADFELASTCFENSNDVTSLLLL